MEELYSSLNNLLATLQVRRANTQSLHWNLKGCHSFMVFHSYFDELYAATAINIDTIAEFIRIHGGLTNGTFTKYLARTSISEISIEESTNLEKAIPKAINDIKQLLVLSNRLFTSTTAYPDINDYAATLVSELGKQKWFLTSSIPSKELVMETGEEGGED